MHYQIVRAVQRALKPLLTLEDKPPWVWMENLSEHALDSESNIVDWSVPYWKEDTSQEDVEQAIAGILDNKYGAYSIGDLFIEPEARANSKWDLRRKFQALDGRSGQKVMGLAALADTLFTIPAITNDGRCGYLILENRHWLFIYDGGAPLWETDTPIEPAQRDMINRLRSPHSKYARYLKFKHAP